MTEQPKRINMVQQVWCLTSTNAGGLSFYFLMHCDRRVMESAARNADGDSTEGENQPQKKMLTYACQQQLFKCNSHRDTK